MRVRLAEPADLQELLAVCLRFYGESRFSRYAVNAGKVRDTLVNAMDTPRSSCVLLAEQEPTGIVGLLVGFVAGLRYADVLVAQDVGFYVLPEYRGGPAAIKLLAAFRRWAENRRAAELNINMSSAIDQARFNRFMRHLGFACCGSNFVLPLAQPHPGEAS